MPQSITPAGIELNPTTEPIEEPIKPIVILLWKKIKLIKSSSNYFLDIFS